MFEVKSKELKTTLVTQILENVDISEIIETVKQRHNESKLPDIEVVHILWDALMDAVQWSGKNQQQNSNLALRQLQECGRLFSREEARVSCNGWTIFYWGWLRWTCT